jgi:hypothetical protein
MLARVEPRRGGAVLGVGTRAGARTGFGAGAGLRRRPSPTSSICMTTGPAPPRH